jgi:hypothetical protein
MVGDIADFVSRLRRVLPLGWFGDVAPLTDAFLSGVAVAWSATYRLIANVRDQTRLATASSGFIDNFAADFLGNGLLRWKGETDSAFRVRIERELLRPRGTRQALMSSLTSLTSGRVAVFEPARPADTGGYNFGGLGYGSAGAWGNLSLPFQSFATVRRPPGTGIAVLAGYATGGINAYGSLSWVQTQVTDDEICRVAAATVPAAYTVWVRIQQ